MSDDIENKFMFKNFEEYAEIMKITKSHPYWEAFEMIWRMARTPPFAEEPDTEENINPTKLI